MHIGLFHSLLFQIALLVVVVGVLSGVAVDVAVLNSYETNSVAARTADIQSQCTILCNQLSAEDYPQEAVSESVQSELSQLADVFDGRVMIIDQNSHIVEDSYDMDVGKTIVSEDVLQCFSGESTNYYDADDQYIEVTLPILKEGDEQIVGVILASISTDTIHENRIRMARTARIVEFSILAVALLVGVLIGLLMVRPFRRITHSIEDVTEGYEDEYLHENAYVETQQMSEAFNKMLGRMKVLDESREQFVSDVSHELKTPLTSMKVLADSLLAQEDVPADLYREFMSDLSEEIERENKIINDLLSLVKLDRTSGGVMDIQSEDINALVEQILKRLRPIAAQANVELVFESFRPVTAEVDASKLSLAITNLVENAIKYNHEGGWVHVSLNADHKNLTLEVADSGTGIPQKEIEHIFERFYRVDKSHSSEIGGTGLGLSIARSAIVMHRGSIKVYSQPGEGTTFTVRIPLVYVT